MLRACLCCVIGALFSLLPMQARAACIGDCDGNCVVEITELVTAVNIVLGNLPLSVCPSIDASDGTAGIPQLVAAVNNVLQGCTSEACGVVCGDGRVEGDEECDDGGTCIGGANAGSPCVAEAQCVGNGVCEDGGMPGSACADDTGCAGGAVCAASRVAVTAALPIVRANRTFSCAW